MPKNSRRNRSSAVRRGGAGRGPRRPRGSRSARRRRPDRYSAYSWRGCRPWRFPVREPRCAAGRSPHPWFRASARPWRHSTCRAILSRRDALRNPGGRVATSLRIRAFRGWPGPRRCGPPPHRNSAVRCSTAASNSSLSAGRSPPRRKVRPSGRRANSRTPKCRQRAWSSGSCLHRRRNTGGSTGPC